MRRASKLVLLAAVWACLPAGVARGASLFGEKAGVRTLIRDGKALYKQGKLKGAQEKFQEVCKLESDNIVALHYLARIDGLMGRFKKAIDIVRKLQRLGVSIYRSQDSKVTLDTVLSGIVGAKDLRQRADLLIHFRETIQGLPISVERRLDAQLMAIYAKQGEAHLHEIVKRRYFASKPIPPSAYFTLARAYLQYDTHFPVAASYLEQAIDALKSRELRPTGNEKRDEYVRKAHAAQITRAQDFLAYTYHAAGLLSPDKNRLLAAEPRAKSKFIDVTKDAGLGGVIAPRVAVGDFDNDGFEDLCLCGRIFKNNGGKTFTDVTVQAKVGLRGITGALWLDYDNDGRLDLLCLSTHRLWLWRNLGNGVFEDNTEEAGLDVVLRGAPEAAAAADYDADGWIDLFVGGFEHPRRQGVGRVDFLFRNRGKGRFEDVSQKSGIRGERDYCARGCAWGDFDNDGDLDLYVANYRLHPNQLWVNQGGGKFVDRAEELGVRGTPGQGRFAHAFGHSFGCAWGDIDNDGDLDLVVGNLVRARYIHFSDTTAVYINGGKGNGWKFADAMPTAGIRFEEMTADASLCDFDNDGDLDLLFTAIYRERPTFLYQNVGNNRFQPVTWRANAVTFNNLGHAWFDKDNDGDMDLVLGSAAGVRLLENQATDTSWLRVQLVGKRSNRLGIGARISVAAGPLRLVREVTAGSGTTSQGSPIAHFGLASHKGSVDIAVRWPDGLIQSVPNARVNTLVKIEEK